LTFYRLPLAHHKHMKSTNMLERLNQEIKQRTHVVRIFPNAEICLRREWNRVGGAAVMCYSTAQSSGVGGASADGGGEVDGLGRGEATRR